MKVLMVSLAEQSYPRYHKRWVDRLVAEGHEVRWASEDWGRASELAANGVTHRPTLMARGLDPVRAFRAWRGMRAAIREFAPDVVVSEMTVPGFLARLAFPLRRRHRNLRIVHSWPWHDLTKPWVKRVAVLLERVAARYTDHFVVISEEDHRAALDLRIVRHGAATQRAVGIDPDLYGETPSQRRVAAAAEACGLTGEEGVVFLFVGRIIAYKGIFDVVEAFEAVAGQRGDAALVVVGAPDRHGASLRDQARFEERVRASPVRDRIHVRRYVGDLPALYAACDVFVMPSLYEGLGLVYLEANAMGLPALGYDVRGVREAIADGVNGLLVPPRDNAALAAAMRRLAADGELRAALAKQGRERWRQRFNNQDYADEVVRIVHRLAEPSPGRRPDS